MRFKPLSGVALVLLLSAAPIAAAANTTTGTLPPLPTPKKTTPPSLSYPYALMIKIPTPNADPQGMAKASDGTIWFSETARGKIGHIAADGTVSEYSLSPGAEPKGMTLGPDNLIWFADQSGKVGKVSPSGAITEYPVPGGGDVESVASGPDDAVWFTVRSSGKIGRVTSTGAITLYSVPKAQDITDIARGPGGLWFTDYTDNLIGKITTSGTVTSYPAKGNPGGLVEGPDGNEWVAEYQGGNIDKVTPNGEITQYRLPSGSNSDPAAVCVGGDKTIWVAEEGTSKLARVMLSNPSSIYEFAAPAGTGPDAIVDPNGNIAAGGFDGNDIVDLIFLALPAPRMAEDLKVALKYEKEAANPKISAHDFSDILGAAIISLGFLGQDAGKTGNPLSADFNSAESLDRQAYKQWPDHNRMAETLAMANAVKEKAIAVLSGLGSAS